LLKNARTQEEKTMRPHFGTHVSAITVIEPEGGRERNAHYTLFERGEPPFSPLALRGEENVLMPGLVATKDCGKVVLVSKKFLRDESLVFRLAKHKKEAIAPSPLEKVGGLNNGGGRVSIGNQAQ